MLRSSQGASVSATVDEVAVDHSALLHPSYTKKMEYKSKVITACNDKISSGMEQNVKDTQRLVNGEDAEGKGELEFDTMMIKTLIRLRIFMPELPLDFPRLPGGKLACLGRARIHGSVIPCSLEIAPWLEHEMKAVQQGACHKALCVVVYDARATIDAMGILPKMERLTLCDLRMDPVLRYLYVFKDSFGGATTQDAGEV